jgi:hypothetical protein
VRQDPEVLEQGHGREEQRGDAGRQVGEPHRQEDGRQDDVEDVKERERVLDAARHVKGEGEDDEVDDNLRPREGERRARPARQEGKDDVGGREQGGGAQEGAPGDGQAQEPDRPAGDDDAPRGQPAEPDEPADALRELGTRSHATCS